MKLSSLRGVENAEAIQTNKTRIATPCHCEAWRSHNEAIHFGESRIKGESLTFGESAVRF